MPGGVNDLTAARDDDVLFVNAVGVVEARRRIADDAQQPDPRRRREDPAHQGALGERVSTVFLRRHLQARADESLRFDAQGHRALRARAVAPEIPVAPYVRRAKEASL